MTETDINIVEAMEKYGGSFVKALAELCYRADPRNLTIIKNAWPHYFEEYAKMATKNDTEI